jgi:polyferredoxin
VIRSEIKQLKTGPRAWRKFGLLVGGVFTGLGVVSSLRHKAAAPYLLTPGILLVFFGLVMSQALKYVYLLWMSLAIVLGFVISSVLLTLLFCLVVTPIGFMARCAGKDFLGLKLDPKAASYWLPREKKPRKLQDYERQF